MHITARVFINDNESGLHADYERWLDELAPSTPAATRRKVATCTTAPAKTTPTPITNGKLDFGPREQFFFGEFDGHRAKRVLLTIIGE